VERRRDPRYDLDIPVLTRIVIAEETFTPRRFPGRCVDISPKGARVKIRGIGRKLFETINSRKRTVQLHLSIAEAGGEFVFDAEIVRSEFHLSRRGGECEFGVFFENLTESQSNALQILLRSLRMKILVVDDDEATILTIASFFESQGHEVLLAETAEDALHCVLATSPDVVFLGLSLADRDGFEVCREFKAIPALQNLYILLMGSDEKGDNQTLALDAGADDFLRKPIDRVDLAERKTVAFDMVEYRKSLRAVALIDPLTGLANRRSFDAAIGREVERARSASSPLALLVIDVNDFKRINDHFGHDRGDQVLQVVARRIVQAVGVKDAVFRIGGDEFAVLLPVAEDTARSHAQQLQDSFVSEKDGEDFSPSNPTISVGHAVYDAPESPEAFFGRADSSMYQNKRDRRARVE
jgi:diguanylate cyclase (GGDEF)-like protein